MKPEMFDQLRDIAANGNELWRTLPPTTYYSDTFFELEREKIFKSGWICVCRTDQVENRGDYLAACSDAVKCV